MLFASDPIHGAAFEIHHCEDADLLRLDFVENPVGKSREEAAANLPRYHRPGLRMLQDGLDAPVGFFEESDAETEALEVISIGRLRSIRPRPAGGPQPHASLQLGASIAKNVADGPAAAPLVNVPVGVTALCLLRPDAGALLAGEIFQALQVLARNR